jgi:hypothetical protein
LESHPKYYRTITPDHDKNYQGLNLVGAISPLNSESTNEEVTPQGESGKLKGFKFTEDHNERDLKHQKKNIAKV